jgi:hypothetical protein
MCWGKESASIARRQDIRPPEQGESSKQKKVNPTRFAYTTIEALTKEQRESFTRMVMEDKDKEDFWSRELDQHQCLLPHLLNMYK